MRNLADAYYQDRVSDAVRLAQSVGVHYAAVRMNVDEKTVRNKLKKEAARAAR